ncbi:MAG: GntR family transcriptional regulator [Bacteroidales bacterium]|nr:GntR family transcriptional regulator [Bacteroidales bacterium]MBN2818800.1 GntR family transcriptional regulator [Bacteroidales bacterium]
MEFRDTQAIYLQIADYICESILQKKWMEEDRIPSVRELAVNMEVNPNTVMRTFNYLQEKGVIYNKRGIGYFITEDGFKQTLDLKKQAFLEEEIPQFIKTMKLLGITVEDLKKYYEQIN